MRRALGCKIVATTLLEIAQTLFDKSALLTAKSERTLRCSLIRLMLLRQCAIM